MDKFTVKIMSSACKMSEITQEGISCKNHLVQNSIFFALFYMEIFWCCVLFSSGWGYN